MYIEDVRIGQVVYVEGDKRKLMISKIDGDSYEVFVKRIDDNDYVTNDCSYVDVGNLTDEPPKEKKRYWLWAIKPANFWCITDGYLDDNGKMTDGGTYSSDWNIKPKKKIESMYMDI